MIVCTWKFFKAFFQTFFAWKLLSGLFVAQISLRETCVQALTFLVQAINFFPHVDAVRLRQYHSANIPRRWYSTVGGTCIDLVWR